MKWQIGQHHKMSRLNSDISFSVPEKLVYVFFLLLKDLKVNESNHLCILSEILSHVKR